jgi:hypothetical protein
MPLAFGGEAIEYHMAKSTGRWVVYEKRGVEYVHVSKPFKTKPEAEKERERLQQGLKSRQKTLGVGIVSE